MSFGLAMSSPCDKSAGRLSLSGWHVQKKAICVPRPTAGHAHPEPSTEGHRCTIIVQNMGHASTIMVLLRSEEHTSELQSLMRISYAVFCLKKKQHKNKHNLYTGTNE